MIFTRKSKDQNPVVFLNIQVSLQEFCLFYNFHLWLHLFYPSAELKSVHLSVRLLTAAKGRISQVFIKEKKLLSVLFKTLSEYTLLYVYVYIFKHQMKVTLIPLAYPSVYPSRSKYPPVRIMLFNPVLSFSPSSRLVFNTWYKCVVQENLSYRFLF